MEDALVQARETASAAVREAAAKAKEEEASVAGDIARATAEQELEQQRLAVSAEFAGHEARLEAEAALRQRAEALAAGSEQEQQRWGLPRIEGAEADLWQAAAHGDADAMCNLGRHFAEGRGVPLGRHHVVTVVGFKERPASLATRRAQPFRVPAT